MDIADGSGSRPERAQERSNGAVSKTEYSRVILSVWTRYRKFGSKTGVSLGVPDPSRRETDEGQWEDPRLATRRQRVKFDTLRRQMAEKRVETPGRLWTIFDGLRWRRQLRRSVSGGMTATTWIIALL